MSRGLSGEASLDELQVAVSGLQSSLADTVSREKTYLRDTMATNQWLPFLMVISTALIGVLCWSIINRGVLVPL